MKIRANVILTYEPHYTAWLITAKLPSGEIVDALAQSDNQIVETVAWLRGGTYSDRFRRNVVIELSWSWLDKHRYEEIKMSLSKFYEECPIQFEPIKKEDV